MKIAYVEQETRPRRAGYVDYGNTASVLARTTNVQIWWQKGSTINNSGIRGLPLRCYCPAELVIATKSGYGWRTQRVHEGGRLSRLLLLRLEIDRKISAALDVESFAQLYRPGKTLIIESV